MERAVRVEETVEEEAWLGWRDRSVYLWVFK